MDETNVHTLLEQISTINKSLDILKKFKKLKDNPLAADITRITKKAERLKKKLVSEYEEIYNDICEEGDLIAELYQ